MVCDNVHAHKQNRVPIKNSIFQNIQGLKFIHFDKTSRKETFISITGSELYEINYRLRIIDTLNNK